MARQFRLKEVTLSYPSVSLDVAMMVTSGMYLLRQWHRGVLCLARCVSVGILSLCLCLHLLQAKDMVRDFAVVGDDEKIKKERR
jgi:hypothetical protein